MFLRKLGKRGAEMVEYAIVLACIAAVGVGFYFSNDSKLTDVLDTLFGNVRQVLGLTTRYNTPLVEADKKYQNVMDSVINGLYSALSTSDNPLYEVWLNSDGSIQKYYTYNNPDGEGTSQATLKDEYTQPGYASQFFTDGYGVSGQTHLYFDKNGNIISINAGDNPHNGYSSNNRASRVVLQDGKKQVYLYYNRVHGDFSSEGNYYTKDIDANTPL